jgi:predicted acetyltransferase
MKTEMLFKSKLFYNLSEEIKTQVNRLLDECFGAESRLTSQQLDVQKDKFFSIPIAYLLAIENNLVIGVVKLYKREISYLEEKIILGGFGGVCTAKNKRRRGVATALLKKGMQELKSHGCDIAYLCTDVDDPGMLTLYSQVGFVPLNKPYTYLGKSGKRYTEEDGLIAPVKSKDKYNLVMDGKEIFDIGIGNW